VGRRRFARTRCRVARGLAWALLAALASFGVSPSAARGQAAQVDDIESAPVDDVAHLPKSGGLGKGRGVELLGLGPIEVASRHGFATGLGLRAAFQLDLGARWALRFPVSLMFSEHDVAGNCHDEAFEALAVSPGVVYRARHSTFQEIVWYTGAGLRVAEQLTRHDFAGKPLNGFHMDLCGKSSNNVFDDVAFGPELWGGFEWHPGLSRWFAFDVHAGYALTGQQGVAIHLFWQMVGLRLMF
jgi:hypothetical protein